MEFLFFTSPEAFIERTAGFFSGREVENTILLGALRHLRKAPRPDAALFAVEEDGAIRLAAAITPPHSLVLSHGETAALHALCEGCLGRGLQLPGVVGPADLAEAFAAEWAKRSATEVTLAFDLNLYRLAQLRAPEGVAGELCQASEGDLDRLAAWYGAFGDEVGLSEHECAQSRDMASRNIAEGRLFAWRVDGRTVSMAALVPTGLGAEGGRINAVYTPPGERGAGYGSACVAALSRRLLEEGWAYCLVFADVTNTTTNRLYRRLGYRHIGGYRNFSFSQAT